MLNEVPAAFGHEFSPSAVQCEFQAPPVLLEEDGHGRTVVDVEKLEITLMVRIGAHVGREPGFLALVYIAVQTNVARDATVLLLP